MMLGTMILLAALLIVAILILRAVNRVAAQLERLERFGPASSRPGEEGEITRPIGD
jgi:hypothetical protein